MLTENVYYSERPDKVYIYPYDGQRMCRADFPTDIEVIETEEGEQYLCNVYSLRTNYEESLLEDMESNYEKWLDRAKEYVELRKRTMLKSVNRSATPNDLDSFTRFFDLGRTVYGGTLDVVSGVLTVDRGYIASYNGETLPSTWISDRDEYASGTTPTIGAEVVYELATPQTYQLTPQQIDLLLGTNHLWSDGEITLTYGVHPYYNPTPFASRPLIKVTGRGTLGIGEYILTITGTASQTLYIDCDTMEIYTIEGTVPTGASSLVSINKNDFPVLKPGTNNISVGSGITAVTITPRWWRI